MPEFILSDAGGIFFLIIVITGIISSVMKSAKEKREREERSRRMEGTLSDTPRKPAVQRSGPSSIEDFLRELAGEVKPVRQEAPKPQPVQRTVQEHKAQDRGVQEFLRKAEEKQKKAQDKTDRKQDKTAKREQERALHRRKPQAKRTSGRKHQARPQEVDIHADAYSRKEAFVALHSVNFGNIDTNDIRRAVVFREVLGPPLALRDNAESNYPQL